MKLSRWIFLISNILTMLVLVVLYNLTGGMFHKPQIYSNYNKLHKTLFVDNHFNDEELKIITQAAQEWTQSTHHIIEFDVERLPSKKTLQPTKDILVLPVTSNFPDIVLSDHMFKSNNTLGYYNDREQISFIELVQERITDQEYKTVVLHELGHALGLDHSDEIDGLNTLMYPAIKGGADHITYEDLKSFCSLYHCDPEKLKN